jgi:hypothetical protein
MSNHQNHKTTNLVNAKLAEHGVLGVVVMLEPIHDFSPQFALTHSPLRSSPPDNGPW